MAILDGKYEDFWAALGVCCSSWVVASRGSTGRSWMLPMGNCEYHGVKKANTMVSRTDDSKNYLGFCKLFFPPVPSELQLVLIVKANLLTKMIDLGDCS